MAKVIKMKLERRRLVEKLHRLEVNSHLYLKMQKMSPKKKRSRQKSMCRLCTCSRWLRSPVMA